MRVLIGVLVGGTGRALGAASPTWAAEVRTVSRPHRQPLAARVLPVPDPTAAQTLDRIFDLLADALADLAIAEARAEVAGRLGLPAERIDREAGRLDEADRAWIAQAAPEGAP